MNEKTWVEISSSAVQSNIKNYEKILPKNTMLMAVVKANAYGHGMDICAESAVKAGVDYLAVFDIADAVVLRKTYKSVPILVLKQIEEDEFDIALKYKLDITVASLQTLNKIVKNKNKANFLIHLKIDTGLSRQGFAFEELEDVLKILKENADLHITALYSHFVGAENKKFDKCTIDQANKIRVWQNEFNQRDYYPIVHISATSGYLMIPDLAFDMVRIGIGMYGLWPDMEVKKAIGNKLKLTPALSWKTKIAQVKVISKGDVVAYNATFVAKNKMKIAVLPVGYWDGVPRILSNTGYVICGGVKCKILGRVMMNMCVVDTTAVKNIKAGDTATIIGKHGKAEITADEVAQLADTINYEIVTRINPNIKRIAIK